MKLSRQAKAIISSVKVATSNYKNDRRSLCDEGYKDVPFILAQDEHGQILVFENEKQLNECYDIVLSNIELYGIPLNHQVKLEITTWGTINVTPAFKLDYSDRLEDKLKNAQESAELVSLAKGNYEIAKIISFDIRQDTYKYLLQNTDKTYFSDLFSKINRTGLTLHEFYTVVGPCELQFYVDTIEWLKDEINMNSIYNLHWEDYIKAGSPVDNKNQALFLLLGDSLFGSEIYENYSDWNTREYRPNYNTHNILDYTSILGCGYNEYLQENSSRLSLKDVEALSQGRHREFKLGYLVTRIAPALKLHTLGLSQYFKNICDRYEGNKEDVREFVEAIHYTKINPKGLIVPKGLTFKQTATMILCYKYFGKEASFLSKYCLDHICTSSSGTINIPVNFRKEVASNEKLVDWIFFRRLPMIWEKNSARLCVIQSLMSKYNINETNAIALYNHPSIMDAIQFSNNYQPINYHTLPEINLEFEAWTLSHLPKDDILNLYIGEVTGCCQKIGGFGEDVCFEGWRDPNSLNYVFKKNNTILAHMWVWKSIDGSLVIDSIEGGFEVPAHIIAALIKEFSVGKSVYISETSYGLTSNTLSCLNTSKNKTPKPVYNYSYTDADLEGNCYLINN